MVNLRIHSLVGNEKVSGGHANKFDNRARAFEVRNGPKLRSAHWSLQREEESGVTSKSQNNANSASCVNSATREVVEILRKIEKCRKTKEKYGSLGFPPLRQILYCQ
jgi:hypothetical protein